MDVTHWIIVVGGALLIVVLVETQFRTRRERSVRAELASRPIIHRERVVAKFMPPSGRWPNRMSRGMEIVVQDGVVTLSFANRLARTLLRTERYFNASDSDGRAFSRPLCRLSPP